MQRWRANQRLKGEVERLKTVSSKAKTEAQSELVQTAKRGDTLVEKNEELDMDIKSTKKRINDNNKYKKELEEREIELNNNYI